MKNNLLDRQVDVAIQSVLSDLLSSVREGGVHLAGKTHSDALHDIRVSTRRLATWLELCESEKLISFKDSDHRLKRLIKMTNETRDLEVRLAIFKQHLKSDSLKEDSPISNLVMKWEEKLSQRYKEIEVAVPKMSAQTDKVLNSLIEDLGRAVPRKRTQITLREFIQSVLVEYATRLDKSLKDVHSIKDERPSHRARLSAKALRYLLEPFALELPSGGAVLKELRDLQDILGGLRDGSMLCECLEKVVKKSKLDAAEKKTLEYVRKSNDNEISHLFVELEKNYLRSKDARFTNQTLSLFSEASPPATR